MDNQNSGIKSFPFVYWISVFFEFMERGAYYGVLSILSIYLVTDIQHGGLAFSKETAGDITAYTIPILYVLPILSGALADRFGYKKMLLISFALLGIGYSALSQSKQEMYVILSLVIFALGAGTFKPVISGTIAKTTNEHNSSLGFGIFYWSINVGAFLFPLFLVPYLKSLGWQYIFIGSAIATGIMIIPGALLYKEPPRPESSKTMQQIIREIVLVCTDLKFILLLLIYSIFWILYFQMTGTFLWYLHDFMDMTPVNNFVNTALHTVGLNTQFKFDTEHVTVINAGTIIALQLVVSNITKNTKPVPTMITGVLMATVGMALLAVSTYSWVFIFGLILFSIGEITAHPKFLSYVGLIAPKDKVGLYMGYSFLYGVIGTFGASKIGPRLYVLFVDKLHKPAILWLIFASFGIITMLGLLLYNKFLAQPSAAEKEAF